MSEQYNEGSISDANPASTSMIGAWIFALTGLFAQIAKHHWSQIGGCTK